MKKQKLSKLLERAENCDVEAMKGLIDYIRQPTGGTDTNENYSQGLRFFAESYYDEAIEDFSVAYEDPDLSNNTRKQSAYYVGLCFENRRHEDRDYHHAIKWYERAEALLYSLAAHRLGDIYETGIYHLNEDTYDYSHAIIHPNLYVAARHYLRAAILGNADCMHKISEMYSDGAAVVRNYERSFHWSLLAACHDQKYCGHLCLHFRDGVGIDENIFEAYVWAVMARGYTGYEYCNDLEARLSKKDVLRAQKEAEHRDRLSYYYNRDVFVLYDYMSETLKQAKPEDTETTILAIGGGAPSRSEDGPDPNAGDESPEPDRERSSVLAVRLKDWSISSFTKLTFHIRPKGRSVQIVFGRKKALLGFAEFAGMFSPYALPLCVDHFKSQNSTEPAVDYFSSSLACSVNKNFSRPNHKVVSLVNSRMRGIFGFSSINEKAFVWITGSDQRQKSLKARIKIMVHYLD